MCKQHWQLQVRASVLLMKLNICLKPEAIFLFNSFIFFFLTLTLRKSPCSCSKVFEFAFIPFLKSVSFPGRCHCSDGFTGDGLTCVDINECVDSSHDCHADAG